MHGGSNPPDSTFWVSNSFKNLGLLIGKAFQLQDDLLEITSTSQKMGKSLNSDIILNKKTYLILTAEKKYKEQLDQIYLKNKNDIDKLNFKIRNFLYDNKIIDACTEYIDLTFQEIDECVNELNLEESKLNLFVNNIRNRKFWIKN